MNGRAVFVILALSAAVAWGGFRVSTAPDGAELFVRENCVKCHMLRGVGMGTKDLTGIENRKTRAWMRDQIIEPRRHEPTPGMPSFAHLSSREIEALLDYIRGGPGH